MQLEHCERLPSRRGRRFELSERQEVKAIAAGTLLGGAFLHWHHCHRAGTATHHRPLSYLILFADGVHNFIGGLAVAGAFLIDVRVGIGAWLAAAAHERPGFRHASSRTWTDPSW